MLQYGEKVRGMSGGELSTELQRIGDPGDSPSTQMQTALLLAQTRAPADLARALGLLQRVSTSSAPDAKPLQPLARTLAARYNEQRRVEDDRDRQVAQLRDAQRRIEQLNDRIEALRAIEREMDSATTARLTPEQQAVVSQVLRGFLAGTETGKALERRFARGKSVKPHAERS